MTSKTAFAPIVCVVDFHHARGPEVETWLGVEPGSDAALEKEWPLLPFMALSDGAHAATEDFSYFTLRREAQPPPSSHPATSLFGISCTRQLPASELIDRPAEVTRSTVQKAVVVITDSPQHFGSLREKLGFVTKAWFAQRDFTDRQILEAFQESLSHSVEQDEERDQFFGASLREILREWKWQTLVLFKCLLLQPKVLFFGSHCEKICMLQFSLISLIPGLIRQLQDCADPAFNKYEETYVPPTSLRTSERASLLAYVGLPLQLFGKGSFFGPYTPLQQLDILTEKDTKSYVIGSTNSLLLAQKERYCDVLVNLDDSNITILSQPLKAALALSTPDRRWIDFLVQTVNDTWDEENPTRPKTHGYAGSEEFIRLQFEEYLLAMLSAVKYQQYLQTHNNKEPAKQGTLLADVDGDPAAEFGLEWVKSWHKTESYRLFDKFTDSHIFDVVEPHHPCSGGLTIEDVQRRLASQVAELHLDERLQAGKETINKHLAVGQKKVSTAFNNLWNDIEVMREAQRQRAAEHRAATAAAAKEKGAAAAAASAIDTPTIDGASADTSNPTTTATTTSNSTIRLPKAPDLTAAQANLQAASAKAGAYFSSWGSWAAEKRKTGWGGGGGGGSGGGSSSSTKSANGNSSTAHAPPSSSSSSTSTTAPSTAAKEEKKKPNPANWAPTLGSRAYEEEKAKASRQSGGGWTPTLGSRAYEEEKERESRRRSLAANSSGRSSARYSSSLVGGSGSGASIAEKGLLGSPRASVGLPAGSEGRKDGGEGKPALLVEAKDTGLQEGEVKNATGITDPSAAVEGPLSPVTLPETHTPVGEASSSHEATKS